MPELPADVLEIEQRLLDLRAAAQPAAVPVPRIPDDADPLHRGVRLLLRIDAALVQLAGND